MNYLLRANIINSLSNDPQSACTHICKVSSFTICKSANVYSLGTAYSLPSSQWPICVINITFQIRALCFEIGT